MKYIFHRPFFIRLMHWEYWSSKVVYAPLYPYWLWLSLRSGSLFFLTAANPRIRNGGFIMESKNDIYIQLPAELYPKTLYFESGVSTSDILKAINEYGITFPMIAKPDMGERGLAVKKIFNKNELLQYTERMPIPFLLQEFIPYENEVGIFYYRLPGQTKGCITGIVNKEAVTVKGDGISTVAQLAKKNGRYLLQWEQIQRSNADKLELVLGQGEQLVLIPYGNHSRGSKFTNESARISEKLSETINRICMQIPEFYYGRLDIRFKDWATLEVGEELSIIEVNGSGSEPTHIYDPTNSIFFAWKEIIRHWDILYNVSKENNKRGVPYITLKKGRQELSAFRKIDAQLSSYSW